jgi:hypothetical protein
MFAVLGCIVVLCTVFLCIGDVRYLAQTLQSKD